MMGSVVHIEAGDVLTRRLALRFRVEQSLLIARAQSALSVLRRHEHPTVAEGLRQSIEQTLAATEALLSRIDPERAP